ncbi:MAG: hypothetical protein ACQEQJ_07350 [Halobacteriota archaeon]
MAPRTFRPEQDWMRSVLPEGIAVGETTLISGPGGSGKPLIGFSVVDSWLAAGGSVVVLLTNSGKEFVVETMRALYDTDLEAHGDRVVWVDFDPEMAPTVEAMERSPTTIRGNLVAPDVWNSALDVALERAPETDLGTLVFGSALNLFLFSPTYGEAMVDEFVDLAGTSGGHTTLFSVSTSAFESEIAAVEAAADTVLLTRMDDMTLHLRGERSDSVELLEDEVTVPFTPEDIRRIKSVAEETRDTIIPTIKEL